MFSRRNLLSIGLYPKIVLMFLAAIVPILLIGSLLVVNGEKALRREINDSLSSRVHFYVSELNTALENIVGLKQEYIFDEDIQRFSTLMPILTDYERRVEVLALQRKMQTLKSSNAYIEDVGLYMVAEDKIIYPNRIVYTISDEEKAIHGTLNRNSAPILVWNGQLIFAERFPINTYVDSLPAYWIEIKLNARKIEAALSQMLTEKGGNAVLSAVDGSWALSGDGGGEQVRRELEERYRSQGEEAGQMLVRLDDGDYIAAYERLPELDIALALYMPESVVLKPLAGYRMWFRVLIVTAIVIILLFAYWIYLFLQRPLQRLVRAFRKVSEGKFDIQLRSRNRDEIDYFYEQFNRMVGTIQSLIHDVYEQNLRSQSAELKHLQAQINPHFLYNSYYRLHRMVQEEDLDNIKSYTRLLGDYLKYITRNAQEDASLRSEVEHAKTYADILKTRFRDKLSLEWEDLPREWENRRVPRLIVQPLVENAFVHGLEETDGPGVLRFSVRSEERALSLIVEDNGSQLTDEKLRELESLVEGLDSVTETTGLLNVHRRLKLKLGNGAGLLLSRSELGGLRAEIRLTAEEGETT